MTEESSEKILLKRLSHAAIGVRDLSEQAEFYTNLVGRQAVERTSHHLNFRAAGSHHHVLELTTEHTGLQHVAFEVADEEELERSAKVLADYGIKVLMGPEAGVEPGTKRLLRFRDPEGNVIELVSGVGDLEESSANGSARPLSLNHVVLFAGDLQKQQDFCERVLGMRVSDTGFMAFLRCNPNHHSFGFIALPRRGRHHAAFDLAGRVELSEVMIRLGDGGVRRIDGPGRHGPGHMLYAYFEDPEDNLLEWCTEIQQIDEATHQPKAWNANSALNLWNTPNLMGPPRGLGWALPVLAGISKLSRYAFP
jgi:catechol 2,3-dioxygenase-like lactoylglutathione lyase family enzyme